MFNQIKYIYLLMTKLNQNKSPQIKDKLYMVVTNVIRNVNVAALVDKIQPILALIGCINNRNNYFLSFD